MHRDLRQCQVRGVADPVADPVTHTRPCRPPLPPPAADPPPVLPPAPADAVVGVPDGASAGPKVKDYDGWVDGLFGTQVKYTEYPHPIADGKIYKNFRIACRRKDCGCSGKTRGMSDANCSTDGRIEPLAFLHVWSQTHPPFDREVRNTGSRMNPHRDHVHAFAVEHKDALEVVYARALEGRL